MTTPTHPVGSLSLWQRLDWRFLLPDPPTGPIVFAGRHDGELEAALGELGEPITVIDRDEQWGELAGTAGTVVLADPSAADLERAVAACRPGGWVYAEVRRRRRTPGAPRSLAGWRRAFRGAGLDGVRVHWHLRDIADATRIVPLDATAALGRVLAAHEGSRRGHLRALAGRAALGLRLLPLVAPEGSVLGRRPDGTPPPVGNRLERAMAEISGTNAGRYESLLLTPREPTSRFVVAFLHERGVREPAAVLKAPRRSADRDGIELEAGVLARVAAALGEHGPRIPAVLGALHTDGVDVLAQSMVRGRPLNPAAVRADFAAALELGRAFIDALPVTAPAERNDGWYDRAVTEPLARLGALAPLDGEIAALSARTHAALGGLRALPLPAVLEHGDLAYPNLLLGDRGGDRLGVIDWERSSPVGVPGHDLVFHLQFLAESMARAEAPLEHAAAFDAAWCDPAAWGRPVLREHLAARGVDPGLWAPLVVAGWARTAATFADRLAPAGGDGGGGAEPVVRASRELTLWRHALDAFERGRLG